jgi:hypothetical protein
MRGITSVLDTQTTGRLGNASCPNKERSMTGTEHYREAEWHLLRSAKLDTDRPDELSAWHQRQAQVHATLALAAATALGSGSGKWAEVAGAKSANRLPDELPPV